MVGGGWDWNGTNYQSVILRTTNGGTDWSQQTSGTTDALYSVYFTSLSAGIAVGEVGTILKTTNSGSSWTEQYTGTISNLYSVFFMESNTGCAVGDGGIDSQIH